MALVGPTAALLVIGCSASPGGSDPLDAGASDALPTLDCAVDADAGSGDATVFVVAVGEWGAIAHCDLEACGDVPSPVDSELDGVHVVSHDQAYAVGAHGVLLHWDGSSWQPQPSPTTLNLAKVVGVGTDLASPWERTG